MVGLLPLFDPPRHDTKETIEECLKKGISVKMVTGGDSFTEDSWATQAKSVPKTSPLQRLLVFAVASHSQTSRLVESLHRKVEMIMQISS